MKRQWFQQDGATCHTVRQSVAMLPEVFPGRIISRGTELPYPSHFPDLTPPDAYVWGMLKEKNFSCKDPPKTVSALRLKFVLFFRTLQKPMFHKLQDRCLQRNGTHFEHLNDHPIIK